MEERYNYGQVLKIKWFDGSAKSAKVPDVRELLSESPLALVRDN